MANAESTRRRFKGRTSRPEQVIGLRAGHAALSEGRSIFPTTPVEESPRLLVDGHNNRKIGRRVEKGAWAGMPIFTLTLEERATCPRSCALWIECYGNAMHLARRHEHGPLLEDTLIIEVMQLQVRNPKGFVVRLHVLGDFYDVEYAKLWGQLLARFPALRVFGYTAYLPDATDANERAIGSAILEVRRKFPDRFKVRFSGLETRVVTDPDLSEPGVLVCPAEKSEKASCGTCTFCWEREEEIAFVLHGMVRSRAERAPKQAKAATVRKRRAKAPVTRAGVRVIRVKGISLRDVGARS